MMAQLMEVAKWGAPCTRHGYERAKQRGLKATAAALILRYGRKTYHQGAIYYSIGRKEITKYRHICPRLSCLEGYHLVMSMQGVIVTVLRNKKFKILKPKL